MSVFVTLLDDYTLFNSILIGLIIFVSILLPTYGLRVITFDCGKMIHDKMIAIYNYIMNDTINNHNIHQGNKNRENHDKKKRFSVKPLPIIRNYTRSSIPASILEIFNLFHIDINKGFLMNSDPLQVLPYAYNQWEILGSQISFLLRNNKNNSNGCEARKEISLLPLIDIKDLTTHAHLRRAHLLLCIFAHVYIWGDSGVDHVNHLNSSSITGTCGKTNTNSSSNDEYRDRIPSNIAIPLWHVSKLLHIPPVLGHASIVLYNWKHNRNHNDDDDDDDYKIDDNNDSKHHCVGRRSSVSDSSNNCSSSDNSNSNSNSNTMSIHDLSFLNGFVGSRDEEWFYLITVEIEARGARAMLPLVSSLQAINKGLQWTKAHASIIDATATDKKNNTNLTSNIGEADVIDNNSNNNNNNSNNNNSNNTNNNYHNYKYDDELKEYFYLSDQPDLWTIASNSSKAEAHAGYANATNDKLRTKMRKNRRMTNDKNKKKNKSYHHERESSININSVNHSDIISSGLEGTPDATSVALHIISCLSVIEDCLECMCDSMSRMRDGCSPFMFYHSVRPYLSGWRNNPTVPKGVIYEGVEDDQYQSFYGGSAAQSAIFPALDIALGVTNAHRSRSPDCNKFLVDMRDYMVLPHRQFLEYLESQTYCIRDFVLAGCEHYLCRSHIDTNNSSGNSSSTNSSSNSHSNSSGSSRSNRSNRSKETILGGGNSEKKSLFSSNYMLSNLAPLTKNSLNSSSSSTFTATTTYHKTKSKNKSDRGSDVDAETTSASSSESSLNGQSDSNSNNSSDADVDVDSEDDDDEVVAEDNANLMVMKELILNLDTNVGMNIGDINIDTEWENVNYNGEDDADGDDDASYSSQDIDPCRPHPSEVDHNSDSEWNRVNFRHVHSMVSTITTTTNGSDVDDDDDKDHDLDNNNDYVNIRKETFNNGNSPSLYTKDEQIRIWRELMCRFDGCVKGLEAFRALHVITVADFIIAPQKQTITSASASASSVDTKKSKCPYASTANEAINASNVVCPHSNSVDTMTDTTTTNTATQKSEEEGDEMTIDDDCDTAGGKGTGGTPLMEFLKPLRDNCVVSRINSSIMDSILQPVASSASSTSSTSPSESHGNYTPIIERSSNVDDDEPLMWRGYKILPNKCPAARITMGHTRNIRKSHSGIGSGR